MKASQAYSEGKFNSCSSERLSATECKITLVDDVNQLKGSFVAVYDANNFMVDVTNDTEMTKITLGGAPPAPALPAALKGGP